MEYIRCQQKVRPLRLAFAVSPSDKGMVLDAVEYSTALWGGLGNILVPIWKKYPKKEVKARSIGLIKDFDPDFIINLTSIPLPKEINQDYKERIIYKNRFISKNKNGSFRFEKGLTVLPLLTHIWETETKSLSGKSRAIIFKDFKNSKYRKFWAFIFGDYPVGFGSDYTTSFKEALKAKEIKASFKNLGKVMLNEVIPPLLVSAYQLTRYGSGGGFSSHIVYVGNPAKILDLIEFWNIRASGREILFLPVNAYKLFGKQVKRIAKAGDYHINERVKSQADIQKSPSITDSEFETVCDWVRTDSGYSLPRRSWLPNWGRRLERVSEDINPCVYYDDEVKSSLIFDGDRSSPLVLARPSFFDKSLFQRLNRFPIVRDFWVNEIFLDDNYKNDYFFNFPPYKELTELISREFIFGSLDKVRLGNGAVVYYNDAINEEVNVYPLKTDEVIIELFKTHGMDISLSPAGLFAKRILDFMGGVDGCRVFKIRGVRDILLQLSNAKPKFGKTYGEIEGTVGLRTTDQFGGPNWDNSIYKDLVLYYQQPRPLTPAVAIDYLFEKNVFRAGLRLVCQKCGKEDWYHLTEFSSTFTCKYCFESQHIGSLEGRVKKEWHYKADGLFMIPDVGQGSLSVVLSLWRLNHLVHGSSFKFMTSCNIRGIKDGEVDFIAVVNGHFDMGSVLILGEARNFVDFSSKNISKLIKIGSRFKTKPYLCFSTLKDKFSDKEKKELKRVIKHGFGLIALTRLELDPYDLFNRFDKSPHKYAVTIRDLSENTIKLNVV